MYIFPTNKANYEVEVYVWVRESVFKDGLDDDLYRDSKKMDKRKMAI